MKFLPPLLLAVWAGVARCISLALLPALTSEAVAVTVHQRGGARPRGFESSSDLPAPGSAPYLAVVLPPPLRFKEVLPPPDLANHPAAAAPPRPGGAREEVAASNRDSIVPITAEKAPEAVVQPTEPEEPMPAALKAPAGEMSVPVPILPDDTPRDVRAEDILPYFQYPGALPREAVVVPVPANPATGRPLPPSSATYQVK